MLPGFLEGMCMPSVNETQPRTTLILGWYGWQARNSTRLPILAATPLNGAIWYCLPSSCYHFKPEIKAWIFRCCLPNLEDPPWSMRRSFVAFTLEPLFGRPRLPARWALQAQEPSPVCPQSKHMHICQLNQWWLWCFERTWRSLPV